MFEQNPDIPYSIVGINFRGFACMHHDAWGILLYKINVCSTSYNRQKPKTFTYIIIIIIPTKITVYIYKKLTLSSVLRYHGRQSTALRTKYYNEISET